jgi:hypothetical protein
MAESVKRRVAAARLAVAFVAAGAIAGATAWAQAGPPPTAQSSASDIFAKIGDIKGESVDSANVEDGSLLFKDFQKGQIPSFKMFDQLDESFFKYKKAVNNFKYDVKNELGDVNGDLSTIKGELGTIKGELVSGYLKTTDADSRYLKVTDADSRYLKLSDPVVRGDGSVFSATKFADGQSVVPILSVPGLISVDAVPGIEIKIKNIGSSDLAYSLCGGHQEGGTLHPNESVNCDTTVETDVMQLIGVGSPEMVTLNFTFFPAIEGNSGLYTVQILVGL